MTFATRSVSFLAVIIFACGGEDPVAEPTTCPVGTKWSADHTYCLKTEVVTPDPVFNDCVVDTDCGDGQRCTGDSKCAIPCRRDGVCIEVDPTLWCGGPQIKGDPLYSSCSVNPTRTTACSAFKPGDMFKVGNAGFLTYILNKNSLIEYFPNDEVYESWRDDRKKNVLFITQDCFDSLPVPSAAPFGVNFRPGSYVVKRGSSDQLYVVLPGNTLAKITVDAARALYDVPAETGGFSDDPMVIGDVVWSNFIGRSADITTGHVHPGMLFVAGSGTTVYYADTDSSIREVTEDGFAANHFQQRFVRRVSLSAIQGLSLGEPIIALVPAIDDITQGG